MARKLNSRDLQILKKIASELVENICEHAGCELRSVVSPVSRHISTSKLEFYKSAGD